MAGAVSHTIRVRFAPSPTGFLHVGGVRTALYNWLIARGQGGSMILRIEDTDVERSTEEAVAAILEGLRWLNLDWDEGPEAGGPFGPYRQLERYDLYREAAQRLLREGKAYACTCLPEELSARREAARSAKPAAWRLCPCRTAGPTPGRRRAVRFHVAARGRVGWDDLVQGRIEVAADELDDFIILRSDAHETPVYNFAAVVDDALMGITHVIRGADHIPNTPKQILLYEALGYPRPSFGHIPLVLGPDREKLSKRHGDVALHAYRAQGYLPEAMVNYLVRLGWAHGDQEVFTREELIQAFRLERVGASPGIFDRAKLDWLNALHMRQTPPGVLGDLLTPFWGEAGVDPKAVEARGRTWLVAALPHFVERAKTLLEVARAMAFLFAPPPVRDPKAEAKFLTRDSLVLLHEARRALAEAPDFSPDGLEALFRRLAETRGTKLVDYAQPIRVVLTGTTISPPLFPILALLGRDVVLDRLGSVIAPGCGAGRTGG
ncbi:MAG: glutamate--tRNA ligase [candidate division NC10 bacterium]|nr:glutamate--tRNA ligase [candidate division NC10 bacterium]